MKGVYNFIILLFISLTCISEINSIADAWRTDDEVMALYEEWMQEHKKVYNGLGEKIDRFEIFKDNLRYIEEHNSNPNKTYELGLNQFSDLTDEEFESMYLSNYNPIDIGKYESDDYYVPEVNTSLSLPDSIDWREKDAVVPIKNQGRCASCWAFSTVSTVETLNKIKKGKLVSLSEQMVIDCASPYSGCNKGYLNDAFDFMKRHGVASSDDYPYKARRGYCQKKDIVAKIDGYKRMIPRDEETLHGVVANQVVSVALKTASKAFRQYKSGIFSGQCGRDYDHAMNVVGYGSENGESYWILRNSWGETWGEKGYMRIVRKKSYFAGHCGVAGMAWYPLMDTSVNQELLSTI